MSPAQFEGHQRRRQVRRRVEGRQRQRQRQSSSPCRQVECRRGNSWGDQAGHGDGSSRRTEVFPYIEWSDETLGVYPRRARCYSRSSLLLQRPVRYRRGLGFDRTGHFLAGPNRTPRSSDSRALEQRPYNFLTPESPWSGAASRVASVSVGSGVDCESRQRPVHFVFSVQVKRPLS